MFPKKRPKKKQKGVTRKRKGLKKTPTFRGRVLKPEATERPKSWSPAGDSGKSFFSEKTTGFPSIFSCPLANPPSPRAISLKNGTTGRRGDGVSWGFAMTKLSIVLKQDEVGVAWKLRRGDALCVVSLVKTPFFVLKKCCLGRILVCFDLWKVSDSWRKSCQKPHQTWLTSLKALVTVWNDEGCWLKAFTSKNPSPTETVYFNLSAAS